MGHLQGQRQCCVINIHVLISCYAENRQPMKLSPPIWKSNTNIEREKILPGSGWTWVQRWRKFITQPLLPVTAHRSTPQKNTFGVITYIFWFKIIRFLKLLPFLWPLNFFCFSSSPFTNWELQTEFWFPHHGRFAPIYGASNDRGAPFSSCFSPSYQFHIYMTTLRVFRPTAFTSTSNSKFKWPSAIFFVFFTKTWKQFRIFTVTLFRLPFLWWVWVSFGQ